MDQRFSAAKVVLRTDPDIRLSCSARRLRDRKLKRQKSSLLETLELSKSDIAHVFTAYLVAYMLGQFLTSYLGRRVPTRRLLLGGMAVTLVCNLVFGLSYLMGPAGYSLLLVFMIINGLGQATGWPGNVGVLSNWLRRQERGRVMAVWATSYQLGSIFAKTFAAFMLGVAGAVWSFWGASLVMAGIWVAFFFLQRDNPEDVGLPPIVEEEDSALSNKVGGGVGWSREVLATILFMGGCYFVFKFLRYALDSWSPMAIEELFGLSKAQSGVVSTAFDWVGFLGVLFSGWISDRLFQSRRYQTILLMTVGMFASFLFLVLLGQRSVWLFGIALSLCGFMLMGPDSLLSGAGAIDMGGRRGAVVAAGLINGLGSIGPIFQEEAIGLMLDRHGYSASFYLLLGVSALGIVGTAYLAIRARRNKAL